MLLSGYLLVCVVLNAAGHYPVASRHPQHTVPALRMLQPCQWLHGGNGMASLSSLGWHVSSVLGATPCGYERLAALGGDGRRQLEPGQRSVPPSLLLVSKDPCLCCHPGLWMSQLWTEAPFRPALLWSWPMKG